MKKYNIFTFFVYAFICIISLSCSNAKEKSVNSICVVGDSLKADVSKFDFGSVSKSNTQKIVFSFLVSNDSEYSIPIHKVDVNCGCVHISKYDPIIKSKSTGIIKGYIDTNNQIGHFSKAIFVKYNKDKILLLRVVGNIEN